MLFLRIFCFVVVFGFGVCVFCFGWLVGFLACPDQSATAFTEYYSCLDVACCALNGHC